MAEVLSQQKTVEHVSIGHSEHLVGEEGQEEGREGGRGEGMVWNGAAAMRCQCSVRTAMHKQFFTWSVCVCVRVHVYV